MGTRKRHTGTETGPKPEKKRRRRRRHSRKSRTEGSDPELLSSGSDTEVLEPAVGSFVNGVKKLKKKSSHAGSTTTSSWSPTVYGLLLLLVLYLAGAVYVYNFVDVPQAIDLIQTRIATVMGYSEDGVPIQRPPSPDSASQGSEPAASQANKVQATWETKDSKNDQKKFSKSSITNKADHRIQDQLDKADDLFDKGEFQEALNAYTHILKHVGKSPRATYGRAQAINQLAEQERSNTLLADAINQFLKVLDMDDVPNELYIKAGREAAARQSFRGWNHKAVKTLKRLVDKYPDHLELKKELGVKYLMMGSNEDARKTFDDVLKKKPDDGFSLVHLGFIVKTVDRDPEMAIPLLQRGIDTGEEGTVHGRFFFHLGDSYFRMGKYNKSREIYELGAEKGLFRSVWQRSLYNVDRLVSQPWWTKQQTGNIKHLQKLEENWMLIRDEGLTQLNPSTGSFVSEDENLRESGDWKQFTLYTRGRKNEANCKKVPKTCALLEKFTDATSCSRGQIKFSVMRPGVHVWPHCGPTNCRIRSHLGLVVPDGTRIRVAEETRTWEEGKFIVFDDSFEHEVWHDGDTLRLVLIIDMWHPDLTKEEKATLSPI